VTTDLDQGPVIAQRAFDVPRPTSPRSSPRAALEADVLLNAVRLHLADAIAIHRGTVHVREDATVDAQLGLSARPRSTRTLTSRSTGSRCRSRADADSRLSD